MAVAAALLNMKVWAIENDTLQISHLRQRMTELLTVLKNPKQFVFQDDGSYPKHGFVGWEDSYLKLKAARQKDGEDHFYVLYGFRLAECRRNYGIRIMEPESVDMDPLGEGLVPSTIGSVSVPAGERDERGRLQTDVSNYFQSPSSLLPTSVPFPAFPVSALSSSSSSSSSSSTAPAVPFDSHRVPSVNPRGAVANLASVIEGIAADKALAKSGKGFRKAPGAYVKKTPEEKAATIKKKHDAKEAVKEAEKAARITELAEKEKGISKATGSSTVSMIEKMRVRKPEAVVQPVLVDGAKEAENIVLGGKELEENTDEEDKLETSGSEDEEDKEGEDEEEEEYEDEEDESLVGKKGKRRKRKLDEVDDEIEEDDEGVAVESGDETEKSSKKVFQREGSQGSTASSPKSTPGSAPAVSPGLLHEDLAGTGETRLGSGEVLSKEAASALTSEWEGAGKQVEETTQVETGTAAVGVAAERQKTATVASDKAARSGGRALEKNVNKNVAGGVLNPE
jgi:hypothetical protein